MGRQLNFDLIVGTNFLSRLSQLATHQDVSSVNQPLQASTTPTVNARRQKSVEPLARFFGCYGEGKVRILIDGSSHARKRTPLINGRLL
jgi:hypothetical protein